MKSRCELCMYSRVFNYTSLDLESSLSHSNHRDPADGHATSSVTSIAMNDENFTHH